MARLHIRRVAPEEIVSPSLARELHELSTEVGRQVGVFINRRGYVTNVMIGTASRLDLPDVGRIRAGRFRFRGLRLIHAHLNGEPLSQDDLGDLALLRLDMVACINRGRHEGEYKLEFAHLMPDNPDNKLFRKEAVEDIYNNQPNFIDLITSIEDEFTRSVKSAQKGAKAERAMVVCVSLNGRTSAQENLLELKELAKTAGFVTVASVIQARSKLDPKYAIGKGKLHEIILRSMQLMVDTIIFDIDLTPAQAKAISDAVEVEVLDRTDVILSIFEKHAHTRDGKLQVELARLKYSLPKLSERQVNLSRITGGIGALGPGETKLEILRRRAKDRIRMLEKEIEQLAKQRHLRRRQRDTNRLPQISIVGYTNAGKSTLLNALTKSSVIVEDKMFATLNPVSRRLRFPEEHEAIITDTVGFIRDLPPDLINAFRATLEELKDADLLLHVVDVSHEHWREQKESVEKILAEIGLEQVVRVIVFNKADLASQEELNQAAQEIVGERMVISAEKKEGLDALIDLVKRIMFGRVVRSYNRYKESENSL